jgi:hypothetical protein
VCHLTHLGAGPLLVQYSGSPNLHQIEILTASTSDVKTYRAIVEKQGLPESLDDVEGVGEGFVRFDQALNYLGADMSWIVLPGIRFLRSDCPRDVRSAISRPGLEIVGHVDLGSRTPLASHVLSLLPGTSVTMPLTLVFAGS